MSSTPASAVSIVKRFIVEIQQNRNYSLIDELIHPEFVDHTAAPGANATRDAALGVLKHLHAAISEFKVEIVHSVSDGKVVATNKIFRGIQVGTLAGKPATNRPIEARIMEFVTIVDGKIKDHWANVGPILDS